MTKVEAIRKALEANGGTATLSELYALTKKFKKDVDVAEDWKAGLRGVLYREIRNNRNFKKLRATTYGFITEVQSGCLHENWTDSICDICGYNLG